MQKHRVSLSQFPSQFWIPGATDLGFLILSVSCYGNQAFGFLRSWLGHSLPAGLTWLLAGIVGSLLHGPFYRVGSFQGRIPGEVVDRGGKMGAQGRKDVWKPVFYSAVLGVTALGCCGTL